MLRRVWAALSTRALERHARNVRKANPWPTGSGAVATRTKGAKMASDERVGVASGTEGEKGTELRGCHSTGHRDLFLRLFHERESMETERDDLRTRLAERDAQVSRLMKRLSEGQG